MFGYFHAQYLFSSALALAMSSLIFSKDATSDMESFETAVQVLHCMSGNGNFAATEFFQNLNEVKQCLQSYRDGRGGSQQSVGSFPMDSGMNFMTGSEPIPPPITNGSLEGPGSVMNLSMRTASSGFTTEMAFLQPTMQVFLEQSDFDLSAFNPDDMAGDASSIYLWPTPQWTG